MKTGTKSHAPQNCLTCFGTGDGSSSTDRDHAAFLYRLAENWLLIDCGEPIDRSYKASGLGREVIDSIFISHLHADHFGGFFMLMQGFRLEKRLKALPVYLPGEAIQPLRQMLQVARLADEMLPFQFQLHPLATRRVVTIGQAQITSFPTSHLDKARTRPGRKPQPDCHAYSFLLECGDRRAGHSGDLGKPADLEPLLVQPLDLLVCELSHFAPEEVFGYLQGRQIKHLVWVHLGEAQRRNLSQTRRLAKQMLPAMKHTFAQDGEEIPF